MTIATQKFNQTKANQFAEKLLTLMNNAGIGLMISVGHRTGLFDALKDLPPSTTEEIAAKTGLNERYVREWAAALHLGDILDLEPETKRYSLPAEHAAFMTRANPADNIAMFTQYISVLGSVEDEIVACFKNGGGVPYSSFNRFHEVMAEDSGQTVLPALFDHILPLVAGLTRRLESGIEVLDSGCGRGKALLLMAERYPRSRFTGWDLSEEAILWAKSEAKKRGLSNVTFEVMDLTNFPTHRKFDFIASFDAVHDQARPDLILAGIKKALKRGGQYLMQDIAGSTHVHNNKDLPLGPLLYTISTFHCMTVSLAQKDGMGLGTLWGEEKALELLKKAGFSQVTIKKLSHDIQNQFYICQ